MTRARSLVAVDVGGTFTDVTLADPVSGETWSVKTATTPADPSIGFLRGVELVLAAASREPGSVERLLYATTVATNAVLEGTGARTGLVTTRDFRHVLEIGRHDGPRRTNLHSWIKPERPVSPDRIVEVSERIDHDGTVRSALDEADVRAAAGRLRLAGVESVAVCLINAWANAVHERRVQELLEAALPGVPVSISSEVLPIFREYERSMTTVLNALVRPVVGRSVGRLVERLEAIGVRAGVLVMQSNGGLDHPAAIVRRPAWTVLSGPAAGVTGAVATARVAGTDNLISLDVGGTSTDVSFVRSGEPELTEEGTVGPWPLALPMIDVHTVGAGGGSLVRVDGGRLMVGPQSAGARPGPASYALGGKIPTVTDAQLVLGRLPERLADGAITLDRAAAHDAIRRYVADPLGLDVFEAAWGIVELADNHIAAAIRLISTERGRDPRGHVLVAGGGAGPLHAANVAALLDLPSVLVPARPGVLSTRGLLVGDVRREFLRTSITPLAIESAAKLRRVVGDLAREADAWFDTAGVAGDRRAVDWSVAMRYPEQASELAIPWAGGSRFDGAMLARLELAFHAQHRERYGYDLPASPVEVVSVRLVAIGRTGVATARLARGGSGGAARVRDAHAGKRLVYVNRATGSVEAPVVQRSDLRPGVELRGPTLIEQPDTTTWVPPGHRALVHAAGHLLVTREPPRVTGRQHRRSSAATTAAVDPITMALVVGGLRDLQAEMERLLERSAMSPFIHEKKDYFAGIATAAGRLLIGDNYTSYGNVMDAILERYPAATMRPADVYAYNDCYGSKGGVTHSPDIVFAAPIHVDGELVGFAHCAGHFWDIGGMRAGSLSVDATEVFQEGLILPPVRLVAEGTPNDDLLRLLVANSRFPGVIENDVRALLAATRLGERRVAELCGRHGGGVVIAAFEQLLAETAEYVHKALSDLVPDGTYAFEEALDSDAAGGAPVWIRLTLSSAGGRRTLDTRASDDQTRGPANYLMHETVPQYALALLVLGDAGAGGPMHNAGSAAALDKVLVREGSVLRPRWPAPLGSRGQTKMRFQSALQGCVGRATGGQVPAGSAGYSLYVLRGQEARTGRYFLCTDGLAVGHGARPTADGLDAIYGPGQRNYPVEYVPWRFPMRVERYGINIDSGGPGRYRGGCGVIRELCVDADEAVLASRLDNVRIPAYGLRAGRGGRGGRVMINPDGAEPRSVEPISDGTVVRRGDVIRFETAGGGGWGHPFDRPPDAVARDVAYGFVSVKSAEEDYGVVLDQDTFAVDARATERRRRARPPSHLFHRNTGFD